MRRSMSYFISVVPIWRLCESHPVLRHGTWRVPLSIVSSGGSTQEELQGASIIKLQSHESAAVHTCYGYGLHSAETDYITLTGVYSDDSGGASDLVADAKQKILNGWCSRIETAFHSRERFSLHQGGSSDCYRLVNGAGSGLPGLRLDTFGNIVVASTAASDTLRHSGLLPVLKEFVKDELALNWQEEEDEALHSVPFSVNGVRYEFGHDLLNLERSDSRNVWESLVSNLSRSSGGFVNQYQALDVLSNLGTLTAIALHHKMPTVSVVNKYLESSVDVLSEFLRNPSLTWASKAIAHPDKEKFWVLQNSAIVPVGDDPSKDFIDQWQSVKLSVSKHPSRYFPLVGMAVEDCEVPLVVGLSFTEYRRAFDGLVESAMNVVANDGFLLLTTQGKNSTQHCVEEIHSRARAAKRRITIVRHFTQSIDSGIPIEDATIPLKQGSTSILIRVGA